MLLDDYEKEENFEECEIIFNAISFINKHMPLEKEEGKLPTKYSKKALKNTLSEFQKFGFKGKIFKNNLPYYKDEIKKMVAL